MNKPAPKALLFDLGGVLIDIDFGQAFEIWGQRSRLSVEEIRQRFKFDLPYERHERGEIEGAEYFRHLIETLQLEDDIESVVRGWNSIFVREIEETTGVVRGMRGRLPCYAFTNTNVTHMTAWGGRFPGVAASFDRVFASHLMGLRKPESAAFSYISRETGTDPESIVFFDDLPENVSGAISSGLHGVLVRSPQDVTNALREFGFAI